MNCLTTPRLRPGLFLALAPLALLAACDGDKAGDEARAPSGEVLEGTISDSMLPLDTVRSQPPLAEPKAGARGQAGDEASAVAPEGEASEGAGETGAAPTGTPAVTPTTAAD